MNKLPDGVTRASQPPFLKDVVRVSNPDIIRRIDTNPDIGRPAEVELPLLFKLYFPATKFYHPSTNDYFIHLQGEKANNRIPRREEIERLLEKGFTEQHMERFVDLIRGNGDDTNVAAECAKIVADLILPLQPGERLPHDIALASNGTLRDLQEVFNPVKYFRARYARQKVERYCSSIMPNEEYIVDWVHNLGAASQGLGQAILSMREMGEMDPHSHFTNNPVSLAVLRMPLRDTTVGGIFPADNVLRANGTIIVLEIANAAKQTHDDRFLFGTGVDGRQCPFKNLFFTTTTEIQKRLQSGK